MSRAKAERQFCPSNAVKRNAEICLDEAAYLHIERNKERDSMSAMNTLKKFGLEQAFNYVYKDPDKNFIKIMDWADKFSGGGFPTQRAMIREAISNPENQYLRRNDSRLFESAPCIRESCPESLHPMLLGDHADRLCTNNLPTRQTFPAHLA